MPPSTHNAAVSSALATLATAGARFFCVLPGSEEQSVSLAEASRRLDVSPNWLRQHLAEFPNAWRLPAGARAIAGEGGRNVGELRIPLSDLAALRTRQRLPRREVTA